jgi:hypothetical protein
MYAFIVLVVYSYLSEAANVNLTMLTDPMARCLDGSQAGYYYQSSVVGGPYDDKHHHHKWVIHLNGGGECDNEEACMAQTTSKLGSSKYFNEKENANGWYLASDDQNSNPDFYQWNHVFNPYCSQDLHSGQRKEADDSTFGLYFSGHNILVSILDDLDRYANLTHATEIILSGVSAGGLGMWMNVDYIRQRYPLAKVTGVSIAGYYFYATYYDGPDATAPGGMADFRESAWPATYELYQAYVNKDCEKANGGGYGAPSCMIANVSHPYVKSRVFAVQSQTDQVVLTGHDCWPEDYMDDEPEKEFMKEWHNNMTIALDPLMDIYDTQWGVFAAACYTHTNFNHENPKVNGLSYVDAFHNFYYSRVNTDPSIYKVSDDCGEMCNPTCI